ncbi:potassium transporter 5 [Olea europaea var. sylvestris]|uniref:Potassium transporter n=2 Tax=Olea europaea subsp. europaea TaxID=158383 RepID=A0A8S0UTD4_OLEEU|nr:potassium transporter 5 [Olea europaea var. sylvestris]CAA3019906.1 potassium transporter 5 [Olea europaea subsp. europaea]
MAEESPQPEINLEIESGGLKDRKVSWGKLRRVDSLNLEAGRLSFKPSHRSQVSWKTTLSLAFQSIGVIYGDIGTSPLYVFASTFTDGIQHNDDILGVLSLIIYTLILVPMVKYVFIVLWANDNGDGGTFALYSLICRYAKVSLIPNDQPEDRQLSNYRLDTPSNQLRRAQKIKEKLENNKTAKIVLFLVTILGTSMVIGDGVLTPCISVLSAVGGIKPLNQDAVVLISIAILIILFCVQRLGTDKVGYSFAPAICLWFTFISGIGLYNLFKHDPSVLRAFYPKYIIDYFKRNGKKGWISLGGVVLCITGAEAMFADLGHFNVRSIQISFSGLVFPALITAYCGQAAYLSKFPDHVAKTFYDSIPDPLYWPTFVVANAAAIIASQAMISGTFSIVSQSLSLGCFPRVKVVHTSAKHEGQVYIPEINYALMVACVIVTFGFKTTEKLGHAYGIAVVAVMVITTCLVSLIMLVIWKTKIWWIASFFVIFIFVEIIYFTSVLYKFTQGGYLPLALSFVLVLMMGIWHYVHQRRYMFELNNKVSSDYIRDLAKNQDINRVPGIGLLYSPLVQGIPPIFPHFISNIPSIHSVLVFVSVKSIPISKVVAEERFLFRQVEPRDYRMFRCVVRYGYNDKIEEPKEFERQLVEYLKEFIRHENFILEGGSTEQMQETVNIQHSGLLRNDDKARKSSSTAVHVEEALEQQIPSRISSSSTQSINIARSTNCSSRIAPVPLQGAEEEMQFVQKAMEHGVYYSIGETEVVAKQDSSWIKKFVVNYAYSFLRKNFREGEQGLAIPRTRLLRVGMTYEI